MESFSGLCNNKNDLDSVNRAIALFMDSKRVRGRKRNAERDAVRKIQREREMDHWRDSRWIHWT